MNVRLGQGLIARLPAHDRWSLWTTALWCAVSTVPAVIAPELASALTYEELKAGVVKIRAKSDEHGPREGTGFVVHVGKDAVYIVTATHVVEGDPHPLVYFFPDDGKFVASNVRKTQPGDNGIAALVVEGPVPSRIRTLIMDEAERLRIDEQALLIGFPRKVATPWAVTKCHISGYKGEMITLQAPVEEGNSGGPLIVADKVVGLITQERGDFGYAVPGFLVRFTLESWLIPFGGRMPVALTGTWKNAANPSLYYVFTQQGEDVSMQEISQDGSGPLVTAEGTGRVKGEEIALSIVTEFGATVDLLLAVSRDGRSMSGKFTDRGTGESHVLVLSRIPNDVAASAPVSR